MYARLIFAVILFSMPSFANAGVFSFVADLFSSKNNQNDSLAAVVTSQNISLLQAAVNPDPNPAKGGGDITVVGDTALLPESGPTSGTSDTYSRFDQISLYVVREGDTLSEIAKMFDVSVNTIMWANDVTPKTIHPGDQLVILPISGVRYVVNKGDTLKSIAAKYKADAKEISQFNDLGPDNTLAVGTTLIIPDGEIAAPKSASTPSSGLRGAGGPSYEGYYAKPILSYVRTQGLHGYNGIDMGAPVGTPIVASATGDVIVSKSSGWNGGYGEYVVISHPNNTQTLYAHMSENISYVGMHVFKGQVIGYVGSTGKSTGPHLHFEVRGAKNPF